MRLIHKIGLTVSLGAALATGAAVAQQQQFINILTGGQSGVYYPMGVALSQIYAKDHSQRARHRTGHQGLCRKPEPVASRTR